MNSQDLISYLVILGCFLLCSVQGEISDEKRLYRELMDTYADGGGADYPIFGRPLLHPANTVKVDLSLTILQLVKICPESQTMEIVAWLKESWNDQYLTWRKSDFGGVDDIMLDKRYIWRPDIALYNAVEPMTEIHEEAKLVVKSTGLVYYVPGYRMKTACENKESDETVTCKLKFGSWGQTVSQINITFTTATVEADYYTPNKDFELLESSVKQHIKTYDCCPNDKYGDVTFYLKFKRRPTKEQLSTYSSGVANTSGATWLLLISASFYFVKARF